MYVSVQDVYDAAGITSDAVAEAVVQKAILAAAIDVDRFTRTTYWSIVTSGTATSGGNFVLADTDMSWDSNQFAGMYLWVYSGTGAGQVRAIDSNTTTALTVSRAWSTNPIAGSEYRIIYAANNPEQNVALDGNGQNTLFVDNYPIRILESLSISSTSVTTSSVYSYEKIGKFTLASTAEKSYFDSTYPQGVALRYWYGVYPVPYDVSRYVQVVAAMRILTSQIGGTYDDPSSMQLPEGSVTVGQAYINIKSAVELLRAEADELRQRLTVYAAVC